MLFIASHLKNSCSNKQGLDLRLKLQRKHAGILSVIILKAKQNRTKKITPGDPFMEKMAAFCGSTLVTGHPRHDMYPTHFIVHVEKKKYRF